MRRIPYYMRRHLTCPDCGWMPKYDEKFSFECRTEQDNFDCPQCHVHYSGDDFLQENIFKWNRTADLENEIENYGSI